MDKTFFSIGMVKNEGDIIESYVRYSINMFDGMIILDNGSTDNTVKILKLLKSEGLPIFIFEDVDREYDQANKMNKLLLKAVNEFKADIVVPLDADEFLISSRQGNPRKILEKIEANTFHLIKWKTYVPDFDKNENEKFIPSKITSVRDNSLEEFYKVIIPKELVKNYNVKLDMGSHDLVYDSKYGKTIKRVISTDLRIAHFPIRSKEQTFSKIAVSWIYSLSRPERTENQSFHQQMIFNKLKENEEVVNEDVINFAKEYALRNVETKVNLKEDPMDLTFCNNIKIRYTHDKIKPISNLLKSCEWLSLAYLNSKKESLAEEQKLKNKIKDLSLELNKVYDNKLVEEKRLKNKIEEYENSTSWRITSPFRKISNIIKKNLF